MTPARATLAGPDWPAGHGQRSWVTLHGLQGTGGSIPFGPADVYRIVFTGRYALARNQQQSLLAIVGGAVLAIALFLALRQPLLAVRAQNDPTLMLLPADDEADPDPAGPAASKSLAPSTTRRSTTTEVSTTSSSTAPPTTAPAPTAPSTSVPPTEPTITAPSTTVPPTSETTVPPTVTFTIPISTFTLPHPTITIPDPLPTVTITIIDTLPPEREDDG